MGIESAGEWEVEREGRVVLRHLEETGGHLIALNRRNAVPDSGIPITGVSTQS